MNKDTILNFAIKVWEVPLNEWTPVQIERIERFAALVAASAAAAEREACAKVCESFKQGNSATYIDDDWADMCAEAIRERGQA